jgi:ATP-binding cassette subfamily B protein IrtA
MKESNEKSPKKESAFSRLMAYAESYKGFSYASVIMSAVSAVLALFPFIYLWKIIKEVIEVAPDFSRADGIVHNGVMAVVMALASMLIYFAALLFSHKAAFRVAANMKLTVLNHVKKLPVGAVDSLGSGRMRKIIAESAEATETYLAHQLPDTASAMLTPVALIVMLFIFDWKLGLVSLIPVVLAFVNMAGMLGKKMAEDMRHYQDSLEDMNNQAVEYVRGMPVVKTFGQSVFTFKKFRDSISSYSKFCISYTKRCRRPMVLFEVAINSVFAFLTCAALIVTAGGVVTDKFVVNLLFYIIFTPIISTTFTKMMFMSENNMLVEDALTRVQSILDMEPLKENDCDKKVRDYSIELKSVSFRYEGAERDAVSELSIKIPQGSHVAFVGPSGGGKSTTAALIARFFDVSSGSISIGGVDIKKLSKSQLNSMIAYVFQNNKLLKMSIRENLKLAKPDATDAELKRALHLAQCDDIIEKLPKGIDTELGTHGTYLSGGETQRIAIARALLKDAPIVILDEATAFADPENESLVQKAFDEIGKNKTVIMIAHRLSTVKDTDEIFVLKEGRLARSGSHEELLAAGGKDNCYKKMWDEYRKSVTWKVGGMV